MGLFANKKKKDDSEISYVFEGIKEEEPATEPKKEYTPPIKKEPSMFWKIVIIGFMLMAFFGGFGYFLYVQLGLKVWAVALLFLFCFESLTILAFTGIALFSWKDIVTNFKLLLKRHKGYGVYFNVRANKILDRQVKKLELNPELEKKKRLIDKKDIYYIKQSALFSIPCVFVEDEGAKSIPLENKKDIGASRFNEVLKLAVAYGMSKVVNKEKTILLLLVIGFLITLVVGVANLFMSLKAAGLVQ